MHHFTKISLLLYIPLYISANNLTTEDTTAKDVANLPKQSIISMSSNDKTPLFSQGVSRGATRKIGGDKPISLEILNGAIQRKIIQEQHIPQQTKEEETAPIQKGVSQSVITSENM